MCFISRAANVSAGGGVCGRQRCSGRQQCSTFFSCSQHKNACMRKRAALQPAPPLTPHHATPPTNPDQGALCPLPHRQPARGGRPHRALQLAVRAQGRRDVRAEVRTAAAGGRSRRQSAGWMKSSGVACKPWLSHALQESRAGSSSSRHPPSCPLPSPLPPPTHPPAGSRTPTPPAAPARARSR